MAKQGEYICDVPKFKPQEFKRKLYWSQILQFAVCEQINKQQR